jgi:hypothetical protein
VCFSAFVTDRQCGGNDHTCCRPQDAAMPETSPPNLIAFLDYVGRPEDFAAIIDSVRRGL